MTWLLTALRTVPVLVATIASGALSGQLRGETAPVPSLAQGVLAPVPIAAVLALAPVVVLLWGVSGLPAEQTAGAARPVTVVLLIAAVGSPALFALSAGTVGGFGAALEASRNEIGLLGLALVGARYLGDRGALLLPMGYLMLAFFFGRPTGSPTPAVWAFVLVDGGSALAFAGAGVVYAAGLSVLPRLPESMLRHT